MIPLLLAVLLSTPASSAERVVIAFTHHVEEEVHPCGCGGYPAGGVARRATLLSSLRNSGALVPLDGGNAVGREIDAGMGRFEALVRSMNSMGYRAATLGAREVEAGLFLIERYDTLADFPLVSANVRINGLALPESAYVRPGVIVTGITQSDTLGYGVSLSDPLEAARRVVASVNDSSLVVILAHIDHRSAARLADAFDRPVLILGYAGLGTEISPRRHGRSVVGSVSGKGRHVLVSNWSPHEGGWKMDDYAIRTLSPDVPMDSATQALVRTYDRAPE